jgi:hypothetical protein
MGQEPGEYPIQDFIQDVLEMVKCPGLAEPILGKWNEHIDGVLLARNGDTSIPWSFLNGDTEYVRRALALFHMELVPLGIKVGKDIEIEFMPINGRYKDAKVVKL